LYRSKIEQRLTAGDGSLEILGQSPVAAKPSKGSLNHQRVTGSTQSESFDQFSFAKLRK